MHVDTKQFDQLGYITVERLLDDELINDLREEFDAIYRHALVSGGAIDFTDRVQQGSDHHQVTVVQQVCEKSDKFRRILYDDRILDIAAKLMGPDIQLFHDHIVYKPGRIGGYVYWHQDNEHWRCIPANNLTCWIALDDTYAEKGGMEFVPGSHKRLRLDHVDPDDYPVLDKDDCVRRSQSTALSVPRGGATFHHGLLLHRTLANTSDSPRRALSLFFMQTGTGCARRPPGSGPFARYQSIPDSFGHPILRGSHSLR